MSDVTIDPGPGVPEGLVIPASEIVERFARSSGPGGQGVNTTDSKVQLSFDVAASTALNETQRRRALHRLRHRLTGSILVLEVSERRSQFLNRTVARQRLGVLLREALAPPPPRRRPTRPTRGSVERRLSSKRRRSETKAARRRPTE